MMDKETDKYLIFVPKHLLNFNGKFSHKNISIYGQGLYQSKQFTTEDNENSLLATLPSFWNFNIGGNLKYKLKRGSIAVGVQANNILNQLYFFSRLRPMPGRNYNLNINYKF